MGSRQGLSTVLIFGSIVLVIAILIGNNMGNRVLGQISNRGAGTATPIPIPSASPPDTVTNRALWKRRQVLSVATDPAFPDPRITPEPPVPATPRPLPRRPAAAAPTIPPDTGFATDPPLPARTPNTRYTAPPVPLPVPSHGGEETIAPDEVQTVSPRITPSLRPLATPPRGAAPGRGAPTLPPVSGPSTNP